MVGAANSDSARISFFGSTKGELAQKLDGGQDAVGPAADSSAPRTGRNGRLLHGSLTLPGIGVPIIRRWSGAHLPQESRYSHPLEIGASNKKYSKKAPEASNSFGVGEFYYKNFLKRNASTKEPFHIDCRGMNSFLPSPALPEIQLWWAFPKGHRRSTSFRAPLTSSMRMIYWIHCNTTNNGASA
ncbi:hypothetical protein ACH5RR_014603 [Cinchona calisaya]|uniref:Uncharacterized protein n=1 Tax=Cinchona calisaya TaxID=153742 RepID=A0ABD3A3D0_9GENT